MCFGRPWVQRAKSQGENPVYYVMGQSVAGRYLFCVVIALPDGKGYPVTARPMTENEKRRYRNRKKTMNTQKLPQIDSIQELAHFWDTHDLTDFTGELEEVGEPVFERQTVIPLHLQSGEAEVLRQIAKSKGIADEDVVREWVLEKLRAS